MASTTYSHARAQKQEWEEKNRIRDLEEKRAMSGASVVNVDGQGAPKSGGWGLFARLEKAKNFFIPASSVMLNIRS